MSAAKEGGGEAPLTRTPRRQYAEEEYSEPDQAKRTTLARTAGVARVMDISTVYNPKALSGKRVVVTGANRGLGLSLATELVACGAKVTALCRKSSDELRALGDTVEVVDGLDVANNDAVVAAVARMAGEPPVDVLINNAGYFYGGPAESVLNGTLNFAEQTKQIAICGSGPLSVTAAIFQRGLLPPGSTVVIITSQAGSVEWRFTQNADVGGDYGHHMSRAACNIAGVLLSEELKPKGVAVGLLHPGFNRTEMTERYKDIWDEQGAVEPEVGARRVLHEVSRISLETTGSFINCEDGLHIPW